VSEKTFTAKHETTYTYSDFLKLGSQKKTGSRQQRDLHLANDGEGERAIEELHAQHGRTGTHAVGVSRAGDQLAGLVVQALRDAGALGAEHRVLEHQSVLCRWYWCNQIREEHLADWVTSGATYLLVELGVQDVAGIRVKIGYVIEGEDSRLLSGRAGPRHAPLHAIVKNDRLVVGNRSRREASRVRSHGGSGFLGLTLTRIHCSTIFYRVCAFTQ